MTIFQGHFFTITRIKFTFKVSCFEESSLFRIFMKLKAKDEQSQSYNC